MKNENELALGNWAERANPRRGKESMAVAIAFLESFPIGSELTVDEFDKWAHRTGHLSTPGTHDKNSDAWKAHIQRRHELRYRIGNAGSTPAMHKDAFTIDTIHQGKWIVRPPHMSLSQNEASRKVHSLAMTQKKKMRFLMESADWSLLPQYEQALAEEIFFDIEHLEADIKTAHERITAKALRLENKIRRAIDSGTLKPVNHGIRNLLDLPKDEDVTP